MNLKNYQKILDYLLVLKFISLLQYHKIYLSRRRLDFYLRNTSPLKQAESKIGIIESRWVRVMGSFKSPYYDRILTLSVKNEHFIKDLSFIFNQDLIYFQLKQKYHCFKIALLQILQF